MQYSKWKQPKAVQYNVFWVLFFMLLSDKSIMNTQIFRLSDNYQHSAGLQRDKFVV